MTLNLLLLMAVSFLPFPTRLIAEAIRSVDAERAAATFYGLSLLVISVLMGALWATAARDRDLLKPDVSQEEIETVLRRTTPSIGFYALVILLALVLPHVAAIGYLVIAIVVLLQAQGDETLRSGSVRGLTPTSRYAFAGTRGAYRWWIMRTLPAGSSNDAIRQTPLSMVSLVKVTPRDSSSARAAW